MSLKKSYYNYLTKIVTDNFYLTVKKMSIILNNISKSYGK